MKPLTIIIAFCFLIIQTGKSQDSLSPAKNPDTSKRFYKVYIYKTESHPAKGYLVTIRDSSAFITSYKHKMAVNFAYADTSVLQGFNYRSIQKMKLFQPKIIGRSILIGALVGIVAGAVIGYAGGDDSGWFALSAGSKAVVGGILGGCAGTVVGAIVGQGSARKFLISGEWKNLQEVKETLQNKK